MKESYSLGVLYKITNSFLFVLITLLISRGSLNMHPIQLFFIISILATVISFVVIKMPGMNVPIVLKKSSIIFYLGRAIIAFISTVTWVYAINGLGFNEATALGYTTSFWLIIMAPLFCGERVRKFGIVVLIANTIGIFLILNLDINKISLEGLGIALFTTALWASYDIICKKQTLSEHYLLQSFFVYLASTIISAPAALSVWSDVSFEQVLWACLIALFAVANLIVLFLAYSHAPVIIVMPFGYFRLIFATGFSYALNGIVPSWGCIIGATIIITFDFMFYLINVQGLSFYKFSK